MADNTQFPDLMHGTDDGVIAENVKTLKNRGLEEAQAIAIAQAFAQGMSDITKMTPKAGAVKAPAMAAPSEVPVTMAKDQDEDDAA